MALAAQALTDYATVKAALGLSGTTDQALLERYINTASSKIATYCNRTLIYRVYTVDQPDKVKTYGGPQLRLSTPPIHLGQAGNYGPPSFRGLIERITLLNQPESPGGQYIVPTDEYEVGGQEQAAAGIVYRSNCWPGSALLRPGLNFSRLTAPGTEENSCWAAYAGGFISSPQAYTASSTWPGPGPAEPSLGQLLRTNTSGTADLWQCVVKGACGSVQPTWPVNSTVGATQADGSALWLYLGTAGSAGTRGSALESGTDTDAGPGLPDDLEQACVSEVTAMYRARRRDPNAKSESLLGTSITYADMRPSGLCGAAEGLASQYRRIR